jgi:hypothetical protein
MVNGGAPELSATASGILLANGFLTSEQHNAAQRFITVSTTAPLPSTTSIGCRPGSTSVIITTPKSWSGAQLVEIRAVSCVVADRTLDHKI